MPSSTPARQRAAEVLGVDAEGVATPWADIDLMGAGPAPTGLAQRLMVSRVVPAVYERWWRPALGRLAKGPSGPSMTQEVRLARRLLAPTGGATVLDVACGTGRFTRALAEDVGHDGVVIGLDVSAPMLARAVAQTRADNVVFARADVTDLELSQGRVDAVCCFAALHLFADPWAALDSMVGALALGGRLVMLASARPPQRGTAAVARLVGRASGLRFFSGEELAEALDARGCDITAQRRFGLLQLVGARRRPPSPSP